MKKKEIAVNVMRKVSKNGKFTMKEEELMNFFILHYNKNKSLQRLFLSFTGVSAASLAPYFFTSKYRTLTSVKRHPNT